MTHSEKIVPGAQTEAQIVELKCEGVFDRLEVEARDRLRRWRRLRKFD
jgi:hypothetical protein